MTKRDSAGQLTPGGCGLRNCEGNATPGCGTIHQPVLRLATSNRFAGIPRRNAAVMLLSAGALVAVTETVFPTIYGSTVPPLWAVQLPVGLFVVGVALGVADRFWRLPWQRPSFAIVLAFFGCLAAGLLGGVSWPNSGDEYSYVFLTDTLLSGRFWVAAPPDPELFSAFHVSVHDGRTFSPYPPAWSALLVPFRALGALWLANPLLTVLLGVALAGSCCRLGLGPAVRRPALALVLLTPFTFFLGGSLFPQTMAAALVASIVWAQLADEARPHPWGKLLIGALFGILLLTRYDVVAVVALVYAIDRLAMRRFAAIPDGLLLILGTLPFVACLAVYNAGVTGNPFQLTISWAGPVALGAPDADAGTGLLMLRAAVFNVFWAGALAQFGGLPVAVLAVAAFVLKIRRRTCRFYDFLFPAALVFYAFMPFTGGHQYGPRYWFWAWPLSILTIATGLITEAGDIHSAVRRIGFEAFASACLVYAAGAFCVLLVTTHAYIEARRAVFDAPLPQARAIVLIPDRQLTMWWWQIAPIPALSLDFTRNGIDFSAPVLYGRADLPDAFQRACRQEGRDVFQWEPPGRMVQVVCP